MPSVVSPPSQSSDEEEYEVQEILGKKLQNNLVLYQVKWKGYSQDQCTWEPIDNLRNSMEKVRSYEKWDSRLGGRVEPLSKQKPIMKKKKQLRYKPKIRKGSELTPQRIKQTDDFEIIGLKMRDIIFKVQHSNGQIEYIRNREMKERFPLKIIQYYQNKIVWK